MRGLSDKLGMEWRGALLALAGLMVGGCWLWERPVRVQTGGGDEFNNVWLAIGGDPVGGHLTLHALAGEPGAVSVVTLAGDTAADAVLRLAGAVFAANPTPRGAGSFTKTERSFPLLRADGAALVLNNAGVGDYYLTTTDAGIELLDRVMGVVAVREGTGMRLRWSAVAGATGYVVFRDGMSVASTNGATTVMDGLVDEVAGLTIDPVVGDEVDYVVFGHRDERVVSPPSAVVRVRAR